MNCLDLWFFIGKNLLKYIKIDKKCYFEINSGKQILFFNSFLHVKSINKYKFSNFKSEAIFVNTIVITSKYELYIIKKYVFLLFIEVFNLCI